MIRINLLLVREVKRRIELRRQLQLAAVLLVLVVAYGVHSYVAQAQERQAREDELQQIKAELETLEKILKEVEKFEERTALLQRQLDAIRSIKTNQRLMAPYLDEISTRLPDQVWLVELREVGKLMRIRGKSLNGNPGVADFMQSIESSALFGTAELVESKSETIRGRAVKSFAITVPILMPKKPATDTDTS